MADTFDLVIIGAGEAGQAAMYAARYRGSRVAIVDRELELRLDLLANRGGMSHW